MSESKNKEPLTPIYNYSKPPWLGVFSRRRREYNGRKDWWTELGYKEELVHSGKWKMFLARYREEDPDWYDRKVEDGTSLVGAFGLDSAKYPNYTKKGDIPGSLKEYQDHVYKNSRQFKQIVEKWDISKEHPGIDISPTLNKLEYTKKKWLGRNGFLVNSWFHFGPHFFNKPMNEGIFEKGLASAKYAAIAMLPYTIFEIRSVKSVSVDNFTPKTFFKRYLQLAAVPVALAFTWGVTISLAANIRHKDDIQNHVYASGTVGTVLGIMQRNTTRGVTLALCSLVLGGFWHYHRLQRFGLQGNVINQKSSGWWGGPLVWKLFQRGDVIVPTDKY